MKNIFGTVKSKRQPKGDMINVFGYSDKDLIDMCWNQPSSDGTHKAADRELNRRYSTRILYAAILASIITLINVISTIIK